MKPLIPIRLCLFLAGILNLLTACNNDTEPQVLQLVAGNNYVASSRRLTGGTPVLTAVYARAAENNGTLTRFKVTFTYDSTNTKPEAIFLDSALVGNPAEFSMVINYTPRNLGGKEHWNFIVTDSKGKEYRQQLKFTTSSGNNAKSVFYTYSNLLLSRLKNRNKDSVGLVAFSSEDGSAFPGYVLKQAGVASKYDLVLNADSTNKPSLSTAPANAASLQLTSLAPADFDAVKTVNALKEKYPATAGQSKIDDLKADQVLAYKTVKNKMALLRVKTIYKTLDSLLVDVKVEK